MKLALFITLILPLLAAESSIEDPVTYLGEHILKKSDLVVKGKAAAPSKLPNGTVIVRFSIEETLRGRESATTVLIVTGSADLVPLKDIPCILFLKRLGRGRYDPVGRVDATGADAAERVGALRSYIAIEAITDAKKKRIALRDLLLENLESKKNFLVWSAARELANFTKENAKYLGEADRLRVRRVRAAQTDTMLKRLLDTALANLGITPTDDGDKEKLTGPEGPAWREVRRLLTAWQKGPEKAATRKRILVELTSRYLKYSGPVLLKALEDVDAGVRRHAALSLGEGEFKDGIAPLRALLGKERDKDVISAIINSLGILKSKKALPKILTLGKESRFQRTAAFAAARIGGKLADEWLDALLAKHNGQADEDAEVRRLVNFLRSEAFRKQEAAMTEIRARRLK